MSESVLFPLRSAPDAGCVLPPAAQRGRRLTALLCLSAALLLGGCAGYNTQTRSMSAAWQAGDITGASIAATRSAQEKANTRDAILFRLEEGAVLRAAGRYEDSNLAFDLAEEKVNQFEEQAKVRLGSETAAIFTNQATLPYRGRSYDKIMLNTYKALNNLHLADFERARVELNRVLQRQRDAVAENARRLEEQTEISRRAAAGELTGDDGRRVEAYDVNRTLQDPKASAALNQVVNEIDSQLLPYADYVNPFSVFLDGLFFMAAGSDASASERGFKSVERLAASTSTRLAQADARLAEAVAQGSAVAPATYVIFETGSAPVRDELRIDIPLFLFSTVSYVGINLPRLKFQGNHVPRLQVSAGGATVETELLASMDSVVGLDFRNEWPYVLTKTIISAAAKAAVAYAMEKSVRDQDLAVRLLMKVAVVAGQAALNQADLRTWLTLPKEFQYCRLDTPEDRLLTLSAAGLTETVVLEPGRVNVVYVRSISPFTKPIVSQFVLLP